MVAKWGQRSPKYGQNIPLAFRRRFCKQFKAFPKNLEVEGGELSRNVHLTLTYTVEVAALAGRC